MHHQVAQPHAKAAVPPLVHQEPAHEQSPSEWTCNQHPACFSPENSFRLRSPPWIAPSRPPFFPPPVRTCSHCHGGVLCGRCGGVPSGHTHALSPSAHTDNPLPLTASLTAELVLPQHVGCECCRHGSALCVGRLGGQPRPRPGRVPRAPRCAGPAQHAATTARSALRSHRPAPPQSACFVWLQRSPPSGIPVWARPASRPPAP